MRILTALLLAPAIAVAASPRHFEVDASFVPARKASTAGAAAGTKGSVAVVFTALDPDLRLNENPAPRLQLDLLQAVLSDLQPKAATEQPDYDPLTARYLDLSKPVLFPVVIAKLAPKGEQQVKARLVFFYCSVREAWCRRGVSEILIPVVVR